MASNSSILIYIPRRLARKSKQVNLCAAHNDPVIVRASSIFDSNSARAQRTNKVGTGSMEYSLEADDDAPNSLPGS